MLLMKAINEYAWWQTGIIYEVYPRSFQDSNGDGVGDIHGIIQRLDYLRWLGVTAIWLTPMYPSPMKDFGYDIMDYTAIDPLFGDMKDFDELLEQVHKRNMKILLDLVPNHTSDQHPWFLESKSSKDNPKRDWYIWKDACTDGSRPNNWLAMFGGSAWEWDDDTQQYYYHAFLKEQPDLNWRNQEVRNAMYDVMRFWLDKGVDGFRVDVMWHLVKDAQYRDNPVNPAYQETMSSYNKLLPVYSTDQPEVHDIVREMRKVLDEYRERIMIAEIYLPVHKLVRYYGDDGNGAQLPFNFLLLTIDWDARKIAAGIDEYEGVLPLQGWPNWVLSNHDQPRIVSRIGKEQARIAVILLLTLRGTPTLYYGDEIEMRDVPISDEDIKDPQGLNMPGKNLSRDPARTPMQWDASEYAGFTTNRPWLPLAKDYKRKNVEQEKKFEHSMLGLYKEVLSLREAEPSLLVGKYVPVLAESPNILAYKRCAEGYDAFLIVLNLSHQPVYFRPKHLKAKGKVEMGTIPELKGKEFNGKINLAGDEGVIIRLEE